MKLIYMTSKFISILIFTALLLNLSCNNSFEKDLEIVSVSILPQKYFIEALSGDHFTINVLIPTGANPASYEPSPRQMTALDQSGLYLRIGQIGFEKAWMPRIEKNYPDMHIADLSAGIELMGESEVEHEHEQDAKHEDQHDHGIDPHIWLSPKAAKTIVNNTANALIRFDGSCKDLIRQKQDSLIAQIDILDQEFTATISLLANRKFLIFHPALTYLARDYDLEQISMELEGKEPSVAHFKEIVDRTKAENIKVIFIQKEFETRNAEQMAQETGARIIQIDPLEENWMKQMKELLIKLKDLDN